MVIAICFDKNYQKWATVCLYSIIKHNKNPTKIRLVILSDIKYNQCIWQLRRVLKNFDFTFDNPGNDFDSMPTGYHFNVTTYWRLALPKILSYYNIEKAIYLDLDVLVLSDLNDLFSFDLGNKICGGCIDICSNEHVVRMKLSQNFAINGGLLLFDVLKMNEINWVNEANYLHNKGKIKWVDQDVINILLDNKIVLLELKYNVQSGHFLTNSACDDPIIIHFTQAPNSKPWDVNCKHPYYKLYKNFILKSNLYNDYFYLQWPLVKLKLKNLLKFSF
jgi:lipopolysaccharide biosynthesis glycosyltransferase